MNYRLLVGLALALLISVGVGIGLSTHQQDNPSQTDELLATFATELTNLDEIVLRHKGEIMFRALFQDAKWQATHLHDSNRFPVDVAKIGVFLNELRIAKLVEAKTKDPNNYSRLGVESIDAENSQSALLVLSTPSSSFELLIGNQSRNGWGTFVRQPNSPQSWLIDQRLALPTDTFGWLQNPFIARSIDGITRVEYKGDQSWIVTKSVDDDGRLSLPALGENESLKYPQIVQDKIEAVLNTRFDTVANVQDILLPDAPSAQLVIESDEGPLTISLYQQNDMNWVTYEHTSQAWLADWVFGLSEFQFKQLNIKRADFLQAPPSP